MRVTSKMMQNTYLNNVNALTAGTQNTLNQLSSGSKIFRASENTAAAVKAYQVRTSLNRNVGYSSNLEHADSILTSSESVLMGIQDVLKEAKGKIVQGLNVSTSEKDRKIIANELTSIREQIFQSMNSNDSGFYIFGGSNSDQKPFSIDEATGKMVYNNHVLTDLSDAATVANLSDDSLYLDIGLAPEFNESENIIKSSIFEYSITGIDVMGYGQSVLTDPKTGETVYEKDAAGNFVLDASNNKIPKMVTNNLYDIIGDIVNALSLSNDEGYDVAYAEALYGRFETSVSTVTTQLTNIGAKTAYIDYSKNRIGTQDLNLKKRQSSIEDVDYAESYTTYTSLYTSYQAALQVGSKIIGPSLFDHL